MDSRSTGEPLFPVVTERDLWEEGEREVERGLGEEDDEDEEDK